MSHKLPLFIFIAALALCFVGALVFYRTNNHPNITIKEPVNLRISITDHQPIVSYDMSQFSPGNKKSIQFSNQAFAIKGVATRISLTSSDYLYAINSQNPPLKAMAIPKIERSLEIPGQTIDEATFKISQLCGLPAISPPLKIKFMNPSEFLASLAARGRSEQSPLPLLEAQEPKEPSEENDLLIPIDNLRLTSETGAEFSERDFLGKISLVNFVFSRCQGICPLIQRKTKSIAIDLQKKIPILQTVSISVDPAHDSIEVLQNWKNQLQGSVKHWWFLTGEKDYIKSLIKNRFMLPVMDQPENESMPIIHTSQIALIDFFGQTVGYFDTDHKEDLKSLRSKVEDLYAQIRVVPENLLDIGWSQEKRDLIEKQFDKSRLDYKFTFLDSWKSSDITFKHTVVPDASYRYKPVHYDHGNPVVTADVDGDGFQDLYFVNQMGANELWLYAGKGRFKLGDNSNIGFSDRVGVAATFADLNNDGYPDLVTTSVRAGVSISQGTPEGKFINIGNHGIKALGHGSGITAFDYDRDGLLDLFVTQVGRYTENYLIPASDLDGSSPRDGFQYYEGLKDAFSGHLHPDRQESSLLFKNLGDLKFKNVTKQVGIEANGWNGDAVSLDWNRDGWPDLYITNMQGDDIYLENIEGKQFVNKGPETFKKTPWGAMSATLVDADADGWPDLFVSDMHSDMISQSNYKSVADEFQKLPVHVTEDFLNTPNAIFGNALYLNTPDSLAAEVSDSFNTENYWPWGVSQGDFNSDGYTDLFLTSSMNFPYRSATSSLLLNNKGKGFIHAEYSVKSEPRAHASLFKPWFRTRCDSTTDTDPGFCHMEDGERTFLGSRGARSSVAIDLDLDGDLDLVTAEFYDVPRVLISNLKQKNKEAKRLAIQLIGTTSNRDGLGSWITLDSSTRTRRFFHNGKSGYLGQGLTPLFIGLSSKEVPKKITVAWPSGRMQSFPITDSIDPLITIKEP